MEKTMLTPEDIRMKIRKQAIANLIVSPVLLLFSLGLTIWVIGIFWKGEAIILGFVLSSMPIFMSAYFAGSIYKGWIGFRYPEFSVVVAKRIPTPKNQPETFGEGRGGCLGYYIYFENYGRYECRYRPMYECMLYGEECYLILDKKYNITSVYQCCLYEYAGELSIRKKNYSE